MTLKLEVGKKYIVQKLGCIRTIIGKTYDGKFVSEEVGSRYFKLYNENGEALPSDLQPNGQEVFNLIKEYKEHNYKYFGMYSKHPSELGEYQDKAEWFDGIEYSGEQDNVLIGVYKIDLNSGDIEKVR